MISLGTDKIILGEGDDCCFLFPCFTYDKVGTDTVTLKDGRGQRYRLTPACTGLADQAAIVAFIESANLALCASGEGANPKPEMNVDGNVIFVCDATDTSVKFLVQVKYDEVTDTWNYTKTDGTAVVENVDFVSCPDVTNADIRHKCFIDDVNGNGSELVPYVYAYSVGVNQAGNGIVSTPLGLFEDECFENGYTLQGLPDLPPAQFDLGEKSGRIILTDANTWSPPLNVTSYTIRVRDTANGSTYTDSNGNTTPLDDFEVVTYTFNSKTDSLPVVRPMNGAEIVITYTI